MAFFRCDFSSPELKMNTSVNIFIPDGIPHDDMKTVYLLHGITDNGTHWSRLSRVELYARKHNVAVFMPEAQRSFYTDMKFGPSYFSYVTDGLMRFSHEMFGLPNDPEHSYVMGLSMGGYGALKCALTYPERYAGCASFSACCDMQDNVDHPTVYGATKEEMQGIFGLDGIIGPKNDVFALAEKSADAPKKPRFFVSCGLEDAFINQNRRFRDFLKERGYDVEFQEWKDGHTWEFWDVSIEKAFRHFFE